MQLLLSDPACQLVVHLVAFHARNYVLKGLGLHAGLLKLGLDLFCLLVVCLNQSLHLCPLLHCHWVLVAQEVDVSLLETHAGQFASAVLWHLIIILPDWVQVLRHYGGLVQLACWTHFAQLSLVVEIFFWTVEPTSAFHWRKRPRGSLRLRAESSADAFKTRLWGLEFSFDERSAPLSNHHRTLEIK